MNIQPWKDGRAIIQCKRGFHVEVVDDKDGLVLFTLGREIKISHKEIEVDGIVCPKEFSTLEEKAEKQKKIEENEKEIRDHINCCT